MATKKEAKTLSKQKKAHEKYMESLEPGEKRVKRQSERSKKATEKGKTAKAARISGKMRKEAYEGSDFQKRQESSSSFAKEEKAARAVETGDKKAVRRSGADKATIKAGVKEIKADNKKNKATKTKSTKDPLAYEDKRATRKRDRDVASKNRKGKRQAGRDAKKKAMENYSPATQKYVPSKEEMKEGRKRAYLAEQAKKAAKDKKEALVKADMKKAKVNQAKTDAAKKAKQQKKADITEMDMYQAKSKEYKTANPDKYKNAADSPAKMYEGDMHSFDQMDSKNAMATAGEGPIKYFKQKISYDVKQASNSNLSQSARNHYARNAQHDMKSMAHKHGSMKGDQSASHIDYANYKGTDKGYHGKTGASHGDQSATHRDYEGGKKKGSVLSKHFRK